jgi:hypothetical protein
LALLDHGFVRGQGATDQKQVIQVVWVYEHDVDFDGLRRFHDNLNNGLLGRRIERSPLPFARHRWVADRAPAGIEMAQRPRPRSELNDWADERSQLPTDPESGSGWHIGVLPFEDGSTAISLVVSHALLDGLGLMVVLADAVLGNTHDLGLPPPRSRSRLRAAAQDVRQTAKDVPEAARALAALAKIARQHRKELVAASRTARDHRDNIAPTLASLPVTSATAEDAEHEAVVVPSVSIHINVEEWNARAAALGGTSHTLAAGFAARFGERIGRRAAGDRAVILELPMSDRTEGDTRANAMSFARVSVDPERVTTDLRDARVAIKEALNAMREAPDASTEMLWLTQFAPRRALKRLTEVLVVGVADLPVFCSSLGDLGLTVCRLDGTEAEYATGRAIGQHVTRQWLEQTGGLMRLQCWRVGAKLGVTVVAYQPGAENTRSALRELAADTLADFDLSGEIG